MWILLENRNSLLIICFSNTGWCALLPWSCSAGLLEISFALTGVHGCADCMLHAGMHLRATCLLHGCRRRA